MKNTLNKQTWISLGVMATVIAAFFIIRADFSGAVDHNFEFSGISDLERIEIIYPESMEGPELIVLERRGPEDWWLTRPIEARMNRRVAEQFESTFTQRIGTDDVVAGMEYAESYQLGADQSVRLALFNTERERPVRELLVGREIEVPQTGVRRTFVKEPGTEAIYRAQAGFGNLVRLSISDLRNRSILAVGEEGVESVKLLHRDGHQVELIRSDGAWRMAEGPSAELGLSPEAAVRLAATLGDLRAMNFFDGKPEEVGLDEPGVVIEVKTGEGTLSLEVNKQTEDGVHRYFVRRDDGQFIYEVGADIGEVLTSRLDDIRDRRIIRAGAPAVQEIVLAGDIAVHLRRDGRNWQMVLPRGQQADQEEAHRLSEFIGALRATRFVDQISHEEAGVFGDERRTIMIRIDDEETLLHIGDRVDGTRGNHYALYSEMDDLFVLPRSTVKRLTAGPERYLK